MKPFRDPIIYPGEPEAPRTWTTCRKRVCALGDHLVEPGQQVQVVGMGFVACLPHADEWDGEAVA